MSTILWDRHNLVVCQHNSWANFIFRQHRKRTILFLQGSVETSFLRTLPCRNNIVRFLCCLKMKSAYELCRQTTKQCQSHKIVLISLQAMFNMHWWTRYARFSGISRGLRWLCGVSSWLQISSLTISTFSVVRADFGRPLPVFLAVVPSKSIFLIRLSTARRFHILFGNSFIIRIEPQPSWVRRLQIRLRSSAFISAPLL